MNPKIVTLKKIVSLRKSSKKRKKKWVFTNGCFDLIHYGHVAYLRSAKQLGDFLIVGLNTDASIRRLKGKGRPIIAARQRAELMAAFEFVDFVVLFREDTPEKLIEAITPDILVKGSDWKHGEIVGETHVKSHGGCIRRIRLQAGLSTTNLIRKIKQSK